MTVRQNESLVASVAMVRSAITRFSSNKGFNEQNTKASLIVPILHALGWDTRDADEVHWVSRRKSRSDPLDSALLVQRAPSLLLKAKALRETLDDHRTVKQALDYAVEAGVRRVGRTNGDMYRVSNAVDPVPAEEKVFRTVSISKDPAEDIAGTLTLLTKVNLQEKKISRLRESHFVDRQVRAAIEELLRPDTPSTIIISAEKMVTSGKVSVEAIRASLRLVRIHLDFPVEPEERPPVRRGRAVASIQAAVADRMPRVAGKRAISGPGGSTVTLKILLEAGFLSAPTELSARYLGQDLPAIVETDVSVVYKGIRYDSPSKAGGAARKPLHRGNLDGGANPTINGWVFWRLNDPATGEESQLSVLRQKWAK